MQNVSIGSYRIIDVVCRFKQSKVEFYVNIEEKIALGTTSRSSGIVTEIDDVFPAATHTAPKLPHIFPPISHSRRLEHWTHHTYARDGAGGEEMVFVLSLTKADCKLW